MPTKLVFFILGWYVLIIILAGVFSSILPFSPTFPYANERLPLYGPRWFTTMAHFDGIHYLTIIEHGYKGTGLIQAFFPLYPILVRQITLGSINPLLAGGLLSLLSLIAAAYFIYRLYSNQRILLLLLAFPTAFFFAGLYTESLFLCLSVGSYVFAKQKKWVWAGVFGLLAGMTRLPGFLISILLFSEAIKSPRKKMPYIFATFPIIGLGIYMLYLWITFSDPLLFVTVQREFGAQRSSGTLIPIITPLVRYIRIFLTVHPISHAYFIALQEFLFTVGGLVLSFILLKRKEYGLGLYSVISLILPTLTGSLSSMPRYVLTIFPLFAVLSDKLPRKVFFLILLVFAILQLINFALFTQGIWVS
jgi:hypothetical protein